MGKSKTVRNTVEFFVAPGGSDSNDGSEGKPFATLRKARDAVRAERPEAGSESGVPVRVVLRGGRHEVRETLGLREEDGGSLDARVEWLAHENETPVISGGVTVRDWQVHEGAILKAELPDQARRRGMIRQAFFNSDPMTRSAYPKRGADRYSGWLFVDHDNPEQPRTSFYVDTARLPHRWAKPHLADIEAFPGALTWTWCNMWTPVTRIDQDTGLVEVERSIVELDEQPWYMERGWSRFNRIRIENLLEDLTVAGEWCIDYDDSTVYFWPPNGEEQPELIIPYIKTLVDVRDLSHVTFKGLTFAHTLGGENYHRSGLTGYGAMLPRAEWSYVGEALRLRETKYCVVDECHFNLVAGNGIYVERRAIRNAIRRCHFDHCGANGVVVIGHKEHHPMFTVVEDCDIHNVGAINNYCAGVFMGTSDGTWVRHNHIHDVPHHAINLATNGVGRNFIEWNRIERAALENMDLGAINSWMDEPFPVIKADTSRSGHVIRFNYIADTWSAREFTSIDGEKTENIDHPQGIYLDDYTSNCLVFGNIVVNAGQGIMIHNGRHNVVENNMFIDCERMAWLANAASGRPGNEYLSQFSVGNHFLRNIFVPKQGSDTVLVFYIRDWTKQDTRENALLWVGLNEKNLYFDPEGKPLAYRILDAEHGVEDGSLNDLSKAESISLDEWKRLGFESETEVADPLFVDREGRDFRLSPESPAWRLGFVPIPIDKIGVRPR